MKHTIHLTRVPSSAEVLASYSASAWLKDAINSAYNRDCVDALRDAEVLVAMLAKRVKTWKEVEKRILS